MDLLPSLLMNFSPPLTNFRTLPTGVNGKPIKWLQGNYGPVHEEITEKDLTVRGILPPALNGAYVRNGPNPLHKPVGGHHWWDAHKKQKQANPQ